MAKEKRQVKEGRTEGCRDLIPAPSVLLLTAPSLPVWWSSVCFGLKPTKSLTVSKPEQHGGELHRPRDSWETDGRTHTHTHTWRQLRSKREKNGVVFFFYNKSRRIMTPYPFNDRVC